MSNDNNNTNMYEDSNNKNAYNVNANTPVYNNSTEYGLFSLIASIAGLFVCMHLIGGILGLYFAIQAEKHNEDPAMYKAGKVISIIDIVIGHYIMRHIMQ